MGYRIPKSSVIRVFIEIPPVPRHFDRQSAPDRSIAGYKKGRVDRVSRPQKESAVGASHGLFISFFRFLNS